MSNEQERCQASTFGSSSLPLGQDAGDEVPECEAGAGEANAGVAPLGVPWFKIRRDGLNCNIIG
eukprot:1158483-Pelagomonas_calceolata.AAC.10